MTYLGPAPAWDQGINFYKHQEMLLILPDSIFQKKDSSTALPMGTCAEMHTLKTQAPVKTKNYPKNKAGPV